MAKTVLFIEDEDKMRRLLVDMAGRHGLRGLGAASGAEAISLLESEEIDVAVCDLMLPDLTGLQLLDRIRADSPHLPVIILTAYGNVQSAVAAMKQGAHDYLTKPVKLDELRIVVSKALEWRALQLENALLRQAVAEAQPMDGIIGQSPAMQKVLAMVERVAGTDATVLLQGESGTGKGLVARAIHEKSRRRDRPFVVVNCAAIPENLLESELFGYRKGAFTGATENRPGKFEAAEGGTIFLDEIGELSPAIQAKLLQATQDKTFMRLGSNAPRTVDVRIIAATNRNLRQMIREGRFREDLYYRLNIIGIHLPTLRERKPDIPALAAGLLARLGAREGRRYGISPAAMAGLQSYHWPGNIRELENVLERASLLCDGGRIEPDDLPPELLAEPPEATLPADALPLPEAVDELERRRILAALREHGGNHTRTAEALGITRQTLLYKMKKLGVAGEV